MRNRFFGVVFALLLSMFACMALADGAGTIVQSSCNIVQSGEYYLVYCYAQVYNNSDQIICLEEGTFELHSGEQLLSSQPITQIWPYFVNPGESGYIFELVSFEPNENGQPVIPQVTGLEFDVQYMMVDMQYASQPLEVQAEIERDATGGMTVMVRLHNATEHDAFDPTVAFGLYTDGGAMVYADATTLRNVGVPAGDGMLMRFPVDDAIAEQWASYGANVTGVQASAAFRDDTD